MNGLSVTNFNPKTGNAERYDFAEIGDIQVRDGGMEEWESVRVEDYF